MTTQANIIVISAPSGAGKTTLLTRVLPKFPQLTYSISVTSRKPREGEVDGQHYFFRTKAQIEEMIEKSIKILSKIGTKAPLAVGMVIDCVNAVFTQGKNGYQTEANSFSRCCATKDFQEGTTAFLEKRRANFKGE